jgi:hypothetical protein
VVKASKILDGSKDADRKRMLRLMSDYNDAKKNLERALSVSLLTKADNLDLELPPEI